MLGLSLALAQPSFAQEKAVVLGVRGGGFNALTSLDEPGTADFKRTGYNIGGTVGVDFNRYLGVRGDFTFARNELELNDAATGSDLNRFFYDAALQVRYPAASGWTPYAFVGAGGVTLDPAESSNDSMTKFAGTVGLGLNYEIPNTNVAIGVEGKGWLYDLSDADGILAGYDKTQFEVTWSAGLSYRIPFGERAGMGGD
ncbi:MAG TPA: porin family protein [Longimicrobiales bacterium]|nr:porin family protein [Longimicrobiales bacterium]